MTTEATWAATSRLAQIWSQSSVVQTYVAQLPANNSAETGIPEMLRGIDGSTGMVSSEPLLPNKWALMTPQLHFVDHNVPGGQQFLKETQPIGFAAECNTAWIRSRLPRFPLIPTPHLARNTLLTTNEVGHGLGWRREALTGGLQFLPAPPRVAELLRLDTRTHDAAVVNLAEALAETPEWNSFAELSTNLTPDDRAALLEARKTLKPLLEADALATFEPERMHRREQYRRDTVEEIVGQLTGIPSEFARAFERVHELIDLVSLTVLGQLVAYGLPAVVEDANNLKLEGGVATFSSSTAPVTPCSLIQLSDPLIPDCAIIESFSCNWDETGEIRNDYCARILTHSRVAFHQQARS